MFASNLNFLSAVDHFELAEDVDPEGLHVARECLEEAFKLNQTSTDDQISHGLMADVFKNYFSLDKQCESTPTPNPETEGTTSLRNTANDDLLKTSKVCFSYLHIVSRDELFGQFYAALDNMNFFTTIPGGDEDHAQLAKATTFFENAVLDMENSGAQKISRDGLASSFKTKGNQAMQSKLYPEAVELYTCAIALQDNAIFYCNRAAAYTQLNKYTEAIADCMKSIELEPAYSKGYSRLGLAFYGQGKYLEALSALHKALQLDPDNSFVQANIQAAEQRWKEEQQRAEAGQSSASSSDGQQGSSHAHIRFNASLPADIAGMFTNMASAVSGHEARDQAPAAAAAEALDLPAMLRSVMFMFSQHPEQESAPRGPLLFSSSSTGFRSTLGFLTVLSMVAD
ncbi:unnamed protein product [Spirodela intermedia]|uniref:Uncharacterized protein n=1 Tax=Spirodela intermedia TaxID=51605 RepID=A0A7I8J0Q7_SPIIN|nr:unnamed protein product [Spirodela intermedia]CAA6663805.1 unnamed protein product [Spirodela intermedia]